MLDTLSHSLEMNESGWGARSGEKGLGPESSGEAPGSLLSALFLPGAQSI